MKHYKGKWKDYFKFPIPDDIMFFEGKKEYKFCYHKFLHHNNKPKAFIYINYYSIIHNPMLKIKYYIEDNNKIADLEHASKYSKINKYNELSYQILNENPNISLTIYNDQSINFIIENENQIILNYFKENLRQILNNLNETIKKEKLKK